MTDVRRLKARVMEADRALAEAETAGAKHPVHILVVEDEVFIRMFISDAPRDEGYTVTEAINADVAIDILKAGKAVDLVFSDIRMPGSLDGIGLLRFIKERFAYLPVILTSGHQDQTVALAEGANCVVRKPYLIATVLELVANELDKPTE